VDELSLIDKMCLLKNKDAARLMAALLAFDPEAKFETPAARLGMMASALGVKDVEPLFRELAANGLGELIDGRWIH
jgi:hypothetical protein